MDIKFTKEEKSEIQKKLGFILDKWAHSLIMHILQTARDSGVSHVYMNTSESQGGNMKTDEKMNFFYEKLPSSLGFQKESVNLRDKKEVLWAIHFSKEISSSFIDGFLKLAEKTYTLSEIPKSYQGAMLSIIGKKPYYSQEEIRKVFDLVSKKKNNKNKIRSKFFYDWSKSWTGGQRFTNINESVVLQKMTSDVQSIITDSDALSKFWSFVLSQTQHFDKDTIGFGLVAKINKDIWVINEIQTDVINQYRKIISVGDKNNIDWETLKDMLHANNRSNWISRIESNPAMKENLLSNPNGIHDLCTNDRDIDEWIKEQRNAGGVVDAMNANAMNMSRRIFLIG